MTRTTTFTQTAKQTSPTTEITPTVPTMGRGGRSGVAHALLGLLAAGGLVGGLGLSSGQALACRPIDPPMKHYTAPAPHVAVSWETLTSALASGDLVVRPLPVRPAPLQGGDPQP